MITITGLLTLVLLSVLTISDASSLPCDPNQGCQMCSTTNLTDISQKCLVCYNGYDLVNNSCNFSLKSCSSRSGHTCTLKYCVVELPNSSGGYYCQECSYPFTSYGSGVLVAGRYSCEYLCPYTGSYVQDVSLCKPNCKANHCNLCSTNDENQCVECLALYLNSKGTCVVSCPNKTYQSGSQCLDCDPQCASCTTTSDQCSSCQDAAVSSPPVCACAANTYFYSTMCVSTCPFLYTPTEWKCLKICPLKQYPSYDSNQNLTCSLVTSPEDAYCSQNIKRVPNQISLSFSKLNSSQFQVITSVKDTPQACYTYQLTGINSFLFRVEKQSNDDTNTFTYLINLSSIQNPDQVTCDAEFCYIFFQVFWNNFLSYSFKIKLKMILEGNIVNSLSYDNNVIPEDIPCEECTIPKSAIISSSISLTCAEGQTCQSDSIKTKLNQPIVITQKISEETMKNRKVFPHSLKLTYLQPYEGSEQESFIKGYTFSNKVPGEITYTFYALPVTDAKLTITSTVTDASNLRVLSEIRRFLDSTGAVSAKFPQMTMSITVEDVPKTALSADQNNSSLTTILVAVLVPCLFVLILMIAVFWGFIVYKRRQLKVLEEKNENKCIQAKAENDDNGDQIKVQQEEFKIIVDPSQKIIVQLPEAIGKKEEELRSNKMIGDQEVKEIIIEQAKGNQQEDLDQRDNSKNEEILPQNNEMIKKKEESSNGECNDIIKFEEDSFDYGSQNSQ